MLATATNGDLRSALNGLELAAKSTDATDGTIHLTLPIIEECLQKKAFSHDKNGDAHYDVISAFQKSIRGSDTDAALLYLARLVTAGDLPTIARRLTVIAYEDIGWLIRQRQPGGRSCHRRQRLGFQARIPLADAVIELCLSPKSTRHHGH